jgi:hypothetical protein
MPRFEAAQEHFSHRHGDASIAPHLGDADSCGKGVLGRVGLEPTTPGGTEDSA